LASIRVIFDEVPAPRTLLVAAVGLGAALTEVSSALEAVKRRLDGGGLLCTWWGKSSPWIIGWCLFID
jgi:hypothetical protein